MAARPRKRENRHLPDHLYFDSATGVYRFLLVTGKRKSLGTDRTMAIAIAREYNNQMRPETAVSLASIIRESGGVSGEANPFSDYADRLLARAIKDEKPADVTEKVWLNDIERVKEFFTMPACDIELEHVNGYIQKYHSDASANVQNRKVSYLKKLFSYAVDESLMYDNPATRKKMRPVADKVRQRLKLPVFQAIYAAADPYLKTAMGLALQTTQAVLEISRIKYSIKKPRDGVCGCIWYEVPREGIFGVMYIHRQKTQKKEASHVAIPIGAELKRIIDDSRDNIASPYVVHRLPDKNSNPVSAKVSHPTQVVSTYISRAFSDVRDRIGICDDLKPEERPTFHEIRALAAHLFDQQGISPGARMAHSDEKSTKIYTENHIDWVAVPHAEIKVS